MLDTLFAKSLTYNLEAQHAVTHLKILHILQDFYGFCSVLFLLLQTRYYSKEEKVSDYNILYYSQITVGRGKLGKFRQNMNIKLFIRLT